MKTNFNEIAEIQQSGLHLSNPALFLEKSKEFAYMAKEIYNNGVTQLAKNAAKECILAFRKVESANCSYTAYANAIDAEKWLETALKYNDSFYSDED